jgi:hypothetical protein
MNNSTKGSVEQMDESHMSNNYCHTICAACGGDLPTDKSYMIPGVKDGILMELPMSVCEACYVLYVLEHGLYGTKVYTYPYRLTYTTTACPNPPWQTPSSTCLPDDQPLEC